MTSVRRQSPEQIENDIAHTRAEISATLDAIQYRLSPVRLLSETFGAVKGVADDAARGARNVGGELRDVGGDFASNLGETIRSNPVPIALLGIGLGWLLLTGRRSGGDPYRGHHGYDPSVPATWKPPYGYGDPAATPDAASGSGSDEGKVTRLATETREGAEQAFNVVEAHAEEVKNTMAEIGAEVRARAAGAAKDAEDMGHRAQEGLGQAAGKVRQYADRTESAARAYAARARGTVSGAGRTLARTAEEHPLLIAATLFAAGAAVAAMLPRTRTEEELMGSGAASLRRAAESAADEVVREAKATARTAARRVGTAAEDIARTAGDGEVSGAERTGGDSEHRYAQGTPGPRSTNGGGDHREEEAEPRH